MGKKRRKMGRWEDGKSIGRGEGRDGRIEEWEIDQKNRIGKERNIGGREEYRKGENRRV